MRMIRFILVTNVSTGSSYGTLPTYLFIGENPTRNIEHSHSLTNICTGYVTKNAH